MVPGTDFQYLCYWAIYWEQADVSSQFHDTFSEWLVKGIPSAILTSKGAKQNDY